MPETPWIAGLALLGLSGLCAVVARRVLPVLMARFDGAVLRVEPQTHINSLSRAQDQAETEACARLHAWCFEGAGDGRSPLWQPWAVPKVERRLSVLAFAYEPAEDRARLIERFSRHLDGSDQLARAGGALAGLLLRLRVKRDDCLWWRARRPSDPWDCGYVIDDLVAVRRFAPRRATLMVMDGLSESASRALLQTLEARSEVFRHPVRVLLPSTQTGLKPVP